MKILNTDDLMEVADTITQDEATGYTSHLAISMARRRVIDSVEALAVAIAKHYKIAKGETSWGGKDLAGLCAIFRPAHEGQPCPEAINQGDPGGDWEKITTKDTGFGG